jgi:hypothetical protein
MRICSKKSQLRIQFTPHINSAGKVLIKIPNEEKPSENSFPMRIFAGLNPVLRMQLIYYYSHFYQLFFLVAGKSVQGPLSDLVFSITHLFPLLFQRKFIRFFELYLRIFPGTGNTHWYTDDTKWRKTEAAFEV